MACDSVTYHDNVIRGQLCDQSRSHFSLRFRATRRSCASSFSLRKRRAILHRAPLLHSRLPQKARPSPEHGRIHWMRNDDCLAALSFAVNYPPAARGSLALAGSGLQKFRSPTIASGGDLVPKFCIRAQHAVCSCVIYLMFG